jgi:hypothetical protein
MQSYAEQHDDRLPPATLYDAEGKPLHSWRVLLLPYLDQDDLYRQFRLDEPWDSPHNLALLPRMPEVYARPAGLRFEAQIEPSDTYCQVFVGPGTAFEGSQGLSLRRDFPHGTSNTFLVVEAGEPVPWTKPADLEYAPDRPVPPLGGVFTGQRRFSLFGPSRPKGVHVAFIDGSVRFLKLPLSEATLRSLITRNGSDKPDPWELGRFSTMSLALAIRTATQSGASDIGRRIPDRSKSRPSSHRSLATGAVY